jgi:hypothetical protein
MIFFKDYQKSGKQMDQSQQDPLCSLKTYLDITKVDFQ